jgi:hypothetical protein
LGRCTGSFICGQCRHIKRGQRDYNTTSQLISFYDAHRVHTLRCTLCCVDEWTSEFHAFDFIQCAEIKKLFVWFLKTCHLNVRKLTLSNSKHLLRSVFVTFYYKFLLYNINGINFLRPSVNIKKICLDKNGDGYITVFPESNSSFGAFEFGNAVSGLLVRLILHTLSKIRKLSSNNIWKKHSVQFKYFRYGSCKKHYLFSML